MSTRMKPACLVFAVANSRHGNIRRRCDFKLAKKGIAG
jgi:hypothetical protein